MNKHLKTLVAGAAIAAGLAAAPALYAQDDLAMPHGSMAGQGMMGEGGMTGKMGSMMSGTMHMMGMSDDMGGMMEQCSTMMQGTPWPAAQRPVADTPARAAESATRIGARRGTPLATDISSLQPLRATMQSLKSIAASVVLLAASASTIATHSLDELDAQLRDREKYFQPIDQDAPAFTLQDAEGRAVSLQDLRGKVVVLHFIYTSCPDVCPLHAERIAEIQEMVNRTPMRELVQFVTITTDPQRDTPEVMRQYGSAHGLDPVNWVFLTTTPDQPEDATRKLAERFGHGFTETTDGYQIPRRRDAHHRPRGSLAGKLPWPGIRADQSRRLRQRAGERRGETARARAAELLGGHSCLVLTAHRRRQPRLCLDL